MSKRPTFAVNLAAQGARGATSVVGERTLEQRVADLEQAVSNTPQVKVGNITINSGTGTQSFTGVGFKPRLLVLFGTAFSASASVATFAFGASTTDGDYASVIRSDATDGQRYSAGKAYVVLNSNNASVDADGDLDSFDDDGFTLDRTTSAGLSFTLGYIAVS